MVVSFGAARGTKMKKKAETPTSLAGRISTVLAAFEGAFCLDAIYRAFPDVKQSTIRGRVYDTLMERGEVERLGKGLYRFKSKTGAEGIIVNGDARDLSIVNDESAHLVMADHPYEIANGQSRSFNESYRDTTLQYTEADFVEKARVLVKGGFLVEFLPELRAGNHSYLSKILAMAERAGFQLYCKIPWFKARLQGGKLVNMSANVGRKSVLEDVYIFTKGAPRKLRLRLQGQVERLQAGARKMFPAVFMHAPTHGAKRRHQAEKPIQLLREIIEALSLEGELVIDQFSGSFNTFFAAIELGRRVISFEINEAFLPFTLESA